MTCNDELAGEPEVLSSGGTAVISPHGEYLAGPVWNREEIVLAELDMSEVASSRFDFDVVGHYARPDVFTLHVNEKRPG